MEYTLNSIKIALYPKIAKENMDSIWKKLMQDGDKIKLKDFELISLPVDKKRKEFLILKSEKFVTRIEMSKHLSIMIRAIFVKQEFIDELEMAWKKIYSHLSKLYGKPLQFHSEFYIEHEANFGKPKKLKKDFLDLFAGETKKELKKAGFESLSGIKLDNKAEISNIFQIQGKNRIEHIYEQKLKITDSLSINQKLKACREYFEKLWGLIK